MVLTNLSLLFITTTLTPISSHITPDLHPHFRLYTRTTACGPLIAFTYLFNTDGTYSFSIETTCPSSNTTQQRTFSLTSYIDQRNSGYVLTSDCYKKLVTLTIEEEDVVRRHKHRNGVVCLRVIIIQREDGEFRLQATSDYELYIACFCDAGGDAHICREETPPEAGYVVEDALEDL